MDEIEFGFLEACQEYANRQQEMLPLLAAAVGVPASDVFYTWMLHRNFRRGKLANSDWTYFFHGHECDLRNEKDGRCLRVDFGPKGRVGILDAYGILRFVMASVPPWREFGTLRAYFATGAPPYGEHSGATERLRPIWDRLENQGFLEHSDPVLMALVDKYTKRGPDGLSYLTFPAEFSQELRADCAVAHRYQLSPKALQLLKDHACGGVLNVALPLAKPNGGQSIAISK